MNGNSTWKLKRKLNERSQNFLFFFLRFSFWLLFEIKLEPKKKRTHHSASIYIRPLSFIRVAISMLNQLNESLSSVTTFITSEQKYFINKNKLFHIPNWRESKKKRKEKKEVNEHREKWEHWNWCLKMCLCRIKRQSEQLSIS